MPTQVGVCEVGGGQAWEELEVTWGKGRDAEGPSWAGWASGRWPGCCSWQAVGVREGHRGSGVQPRHSPSLLPLPYAFYDCDDRNSHLTFILKIDFSKMLLLSELFAYRKSI